MCSSLLCVGFSLISDSYALALEVSQVVASLASAGQSAHCRRRYSPVHFPVAGCFCPFGLTHSFVLRRRALLAAGGFADTNDPQTSGFPLFFCLLVITNVIWFAWQMKPKNRSVLVLECELVKCCIWRDAVAVVRVVCVVNGRLSNARAAGVRCAHRGNQANRVRCRYALFVAFVLFC